MIRVVRHPLGRRVYLIRARLHHGLVGTILVAVGLVLIAHDLRDFPWLSD